MYRKAPMIVFFLGLTVAALSSPSYAQQHDPSGHGPSAPASAEPTALQQRPRPSEKVNGGEFQ